MSINEDRRATSLSERNERLVYVVPEEVLRATATGELTVRELLQVLWRRKWIIAVVSALFAVGSVVAALTATEWYRAEALLAPAKESSTQSLTGALGGLASLAGVSVTDTDTEEVLAVLTSRAFVADFIEDLDLLPVLLSQQEPEESPDIRDAVRFFHENVLRVSRDSDTGLITLAVEWIDPAIAAEWANALVYRLNQRQRQRALNEANANVEYLREELDKTTVVSLQQSIGRLLENELQKLMLARGNDEFAFRVLDAAQPPKLRARPQRTLLVAAGTLLGFLIGVLLALGVDTLRGHKAGRKGDR